MITSVLSRFIGWCQLIFFSFILRDFYLSCRAVGVRPPLELSHSLVQFGATAIGDHSTALLYLTNHEISPDRSNQPRASAAKGAVAPVAPRLFSFTPPKDAHISITPPAGSLQPGEVQHNIQYYIRLGTKNLSIIFLPKSWMWDAWKMLDYTFF